MAARDREWGR
uniref:Calcium-dependent protein kinase, isoform AK1 n=1 Tax=Arundo donax TaxID=35708 RepID=A0A0A8XPT2_ARUDO